MIRLAVTSSTSVVGVAVGTSETVLGFEQIYTDRQHAEELTPLIKKVVEEAGVSFSDIEFFVLDVGPGRFTGLRVGIAAVVGLAFAVDKPVVEVSSLEILAAGQIPDTSPVLAVVDARRNEVFQQVFSAEGALSEPVVGAPSVVDGYDAVQVVIGDGADQYAEIYGERLVEGVVPSAAVMLRIGEGRDFVEAERIRPLYLREPDAKVNIRTRATES